MDMSLPSLNASMIDHYLTSGKHDHAIDALMRVVPTGFATVRDYSALDYFVCQLPEEQRPVIAEEHTVVAAIKK